MSEIPLAKESTDVYGMGWEWELFCHFPCWFVPDAYDEDDEVNESIGSESVNRCEERDVKLFGKARCPLDL